MEHWECGDGATREKSYTSGCHSSQKSSSESHTSQFSKIVVKSFSAKLVEKNEDVHG
jgi:hypothetical protein